MKVLAVAFFFHLLDRYEAHRSRIHAISHAGRLWPIVKNMTKVRISFVRANFGALHVKRPVGLFDNVGAVDRLCKTCANRTAANLSVEEKRGSPLIKST